MKTSCIILLSAAFVCGSVYAQDLQIVNTHGSLLHLNPSFAGSNGGFRNQINYRAQDKNTGGSAISVSNVADMHLKKLNAGIALGVREDSYSRGTIISREISFAYAQNIKFGESKIIPSVQFNYFHRTLDLSRLSFAEILDPRFPVKIPGGITMPVVARKSNFDASAGLLFQLRDLYAGLSVFHINQPDEGFLGASKLNARVNAHLSYNIRFGEKSLLNLSARGSQQGEFRYGQVIGTVMAMRHLVAGVGYSSADWGYSNNTAVLSLGFIENRSSFTILYRGDFSQGGLNELWEANFSLGFRGKDKAGQLQNFEAW